ncbi:hypothetical protein WJX74_008538 [Apatococcus lobatus]|uniref:UBL3-like ubiquitin domain-containing protein n=1 Tax=Apatococcus lobatus TaxID=904363 RepID=A0AAW1RVL5_9CHLO
MHFGATWGVALAGSGLQAFTRQMQDFGAAVTRIDLHICLLPGDIGPLKFPNTASVQDARERLFSDWPKDFPADAPTAPSDIKLICNGKFLSGVETLNELRALMGDPRADQIMTLHLVIRPQAAVKSSAKGSDKPPSKRCCVIQ